MVLLKYKAIKTEAAKRVRLFGSYISFVAFVWPGIQFVIYRVICVLRSSKRTRCFVFGYKYIHKLNACILFTGNFFHSFYISPLLCFVVLKQLT